VADETLAERAARLVADAFEVHKAAFLEITRRAPARFSARDWRGSREDALERLEAYSRSLGPLLARLEQMLGDGLKEKAFWSAMKMAFVRRVAGRGDVELLETFFNSASRKVFSTVGVDRRVEFVAAEMDDAAGAGLLPLRIHAGRPLARLLEEVLEGHAFACGYEDQERDVAAAAEAAEAHLVRVWGSASFDAMDVLGPVFFRNKGAYIVGRVRRGRDVLPIVLSLLNPHGSVVVDAVLLAEDEVSIVFSFTRSYFHVDVEDPAPLVRFLKTIMPKKPVAELYIAIGRNKHGKTELYRDLLAHLATSDDSFVLAAGEPGMVMLVFTLPSFDVVFKIIRDTFGFGKTSSRQDVMDKYRLVFRHGRAGRLVDTQEFEHLEFPRARFSPELLERLQAFCGASVLIDEERVVIRHLYTERRLVPLNLYIARAGEALAVEAVVDFGEGIRELAATNIFAGDLLLKNFGVTRHGRVAFYDYDELCLLTECNFRELPAGSDEEGEPTFYVGEHDVFPEEFLPFLGLRGALREAFLRAHSDLLDVGFWLEMKKRVRAGEIFDVYPYPQARRLRPAA
jgi:isocitrate dehydrogenase kinase/phosphatase